MSYHVSAGEFEGPIGLLLNLISAQKLDLFEFSISALVDDYLCALADMKDMNLEISTEFLGVAATLIGLKARRLLPNGVEDSEEEDWSSADEREVLLIRLIEAAMFRDVSEELRQYAAITATSIARAVGPPPEFLNDVPDPLDSVKVEHLTAALGRLLAQVDSQHVDSSHITVSPVSAKQVGERLLEAMEAKETASFSEMVGFASTRYEVIVCFLVLLEAFRLGLVDLSGEESVEVSASSLSTLGQRERFLHLLEEFA